MKVTTILYNLRILFKRLHNSLQKSTQFSTEFSTQFLTEFATNQYKISTKVCQILYKSVQIFFKSLCNYLQKPILHNSLQKSTQFPTKVYTILQNSLQKSEFSSKVNTILYKPVQILYKSQHNSLQICTNAPQKPIEFPTKAYTILHKSLDSSLQKHSLQKSTQFSTNQYKPPTSLYDSLEKSSEFPTKVYTILHKSVHNSLQKPEFYRILYKSLQNSLQKPTKFLAKAHRILCKGLQNSLQKSAELSTEFPSKVYTILCKSLQNTLQKSKACPLSICLSYFLTIAYLGSWHSIWWFFSFFYFAVPPCPRHRNHLSRHVREFGKC